MEQLFEEYLSYLRIERGSASKTVEAYGRDLRKFRLYLEEQGIAFDDVQRDNIVAFEMQLMK